MLYIAFIGIRHTVKRVTLEEPEDILFTEVTEPAGGPKAGPERGRRREGHMTPRGPARHRLRGLPARGRRSARVAVRPHAPQLAALSHRRLQLRPATRRWECPEGQHLRLHEFDHERRLAHYRAKAHICNRCPSKDACTDSDEGREISRPLDPWPHSEAGRFHRGIAVLMVALALLVCLVAIARNHAPGEPALLSASSRSPLWPAAGSCATSAATRGLPGASPSHGLSTAGGGRSRWGRRTGPAIGRVELEAWSLIRFLHVTALALFVGGQLMLVAAVVPALSGREGEPMRAVARRFGVASAAALVVLVATGVAMAGHFSRWGDDTLNAKVALLVLVVVLVALHVATPHTRPVATLCFVSSLLVVWFGVQLSH